MTCKIYSSGRSPTRLKETQNVSWKLRNPVLCFAFNKLNKENVCEINLFRKFSFLSLKVLLAQIDVRNETSQHHSWKSVKMNTDITLLSDEMFQSVSGHSSEQSIAH